MTGKFKKMRSLTAMVLVLLMLILIPIQAGAATAPAKIGQKITVHFYNAQHWTTPRLYYFNDTEHEYEWPGAAMQNDGNGWYSYTINGVSETDVVFNDGGTQQLPVSSYDSYHVTKDTWYANGTFYNKAPENIKEPAPIVVHFYNKDNWSQVYMHYYSTDNKMVGDKWPGSVMESEGNGWFRYTIYGYGEAKVIFNNSLGEQTPQASVDGSPADGYLTSGEKWFADGKWYEQNPRQITVHYYNDGSWKTPYIYYYSDGINTPSWPGTKMVSEGNGWYQYTIMDCNQAKVIFSDNGSSQIPAKDQEGYLVDNEKWYARGTWYSEKPNSFRVHYFNENNWKTPYLYYYDGGKNGGTWPGSKMKADHYGWYSYDIIGYDQAKVIFSNNGASQNPAQGQEKFLVDKDKWYLNGTWHEEEPEHITVHYYNYDNWNKVNLYYYDGDKTGSDWTGLPMTSDGDGWYTYKIYGYDQAKVLFNNGGSIQIPGRLEEGFPVSKELWYRGGTWTKERPQDINIYFYKPSDWSAPNLYYYKNDQDQGAVWPGQKMNGANENIIGEYSENWYTFKITKYSQAKVILNDGTHQIPGAMQEGVSAKGNMWYKEGVWCDDKSDTDKDGLLDCIELMIGTNMNKSDSDGDGLTDGYEVNVLGTNPLLKDTDGNGTADGDEDFDNDGLSNLQEYQHNGNPVSSDTDDDGLNDLVEYNMGTKLDDKDTDKDGLSDSQELDFDTDPLNPDSNGNGILDGDENYNKTFTSEDFATSVENNVIPKIDITASGEQLTTLDISKVDDDDFLCQEIPGFISSAYDFSMDGSFQSANLSFSFDESLLDSAEFKPAIYYYDEEQQLLVELENQTVSGNIVSAPLNHFSKYILLNKKDFDKVWEEEIKNPSQGEDILKYIDVSLVMDSSGSMDWSDPRDIRKDVAKEFVDKLGVDDRASVIDFDDSATVLSNFTSNKDVLKAAINRIDSNGGTSLTVGIQSAIQLFENDTYRTQPVNKFLIMLTDGEGSYNSLLTQRAIDNNIIIYTIGLGSEVDTNLLTNIATQTGGKYYHADAAGDLVDQFEDISSSIDLTKDSDNDGLCDYFEDHIRLGNGVMLRTDKNNPDTDGDGLLDNEEVEFAYANGGLPYFKLKSDPTTKYSDGDVYDDYTELKINHTDAMKNNVAMAGYDIDYVAKNESFISMQYKKAYESDSGRQLSLWIANNVYGSNYDQKLIYKQELIEYMEQLNKSMQEENECRAAADAAKSYIGVVKNKLDDIVKKNIAVDSTDWMNNLKQQISNQNANIEDIKALVGKGKISKAEFYNRLDQFTSEIRTASEKYEELKNAMADKIILPEKLVNGYKKFSKTVGFALGVLDVGISVADTIRDYAEINANMTTIANNLYLLENIRDNSADSSMRDAARELIEATDGNFFSSLVNGAERIGEMGISAAKFKVINMIPVYGIWVNIGLSLADILFNVSATGKQAVRVLGAGDSSFILQSDMQSHLLLNAQRQTDANGQQIYVVYEPNAIYSGNKFFNLSSMLIFGENQMIKLLTENHQWLYDLADFFGSDTQGTINACRNSITALNRIKYKYVAAA